MGLKKFLTSKLNRKIAFGFVVLSLLIILVGSVTYYTPSGLVISENGDLYTGNSLGKMITLLAIIGSLVIATLLGFYTSKSITEPVSQLTEATKRLEKGDYKTEVDIKTGDELELLGDTFNQTVKTLGRTDQERKQLDKAKTELLSITSHELRSPMTPIKAQLQMLIDNYFGDINVKQKESLNTILKNTNRLDKMIEEFLEISKIQAARLEIKLINTDLTKEINEVVQETKDIMPSKKIKIISNVSLPEFSTDPFLIKRVLRNLLENAVKFSGKNTKITIEGRQSENFILFSIKDQGIGISKKNQKLIFEPFFQAEQTMYREKGGAGLGLSISKGIVESLKGKIWVESKEGKGSTFYFKVPVKSSKESYSKQI